MRRLDRSAALDQGLFGLVPLIATGYLLHQVLAGHLVAVDFRQAYWVAGARVLHGSSPYSWSAEAIRSGAAFVYPALSALLFAPFGAISVGAGEALFTAISILAALATLRVLDVRDGRLYGLVLVCAPVVAAWQTANLTLLLVLGLALLWRHRERPAAAGVLAAVLVSLKPFTWPVALWLLATRRYRALGWALGAAVALNLVAWGVIGFGQVGSYLHLSREVTGALVGSGYGVIASAIALGADRALGTALEAGLSCALAGGCLLAGRRGREREALTVCVVLMLAASPLVWNHYFALLIVPLAIARPRLSWIWSVGLVLWVCPSDGAAAWQVAVAWLAVAVTACGLNGLPHALRARLRPRPLPGTLTGSGVR
jgi:Glycosyltransferase family 87